MGNDQSQLKGLEIDEQPIETTDFWSLYAGETQQNNITGSNSLISIFQAEPVVSGQFWAIQSPLDRATKNLMVFRHPSILRYIASWKRGSTQCLATEQCRPFALEIQSQTDIQICLGLRSILCGLIFLIEQAKARHFNICPASIYIAADGTWRLFGFEYVWKVADINRSIIERLKPYRYEKAVDPLEDQHKNVGIEQYAFGVLCEDVLEHQKNTTNDSGTMEIASEFKSYCTSHLKHKNVALRPNLSAILLHPYFNHEFILIHSFLCELPLKSQQDRQNFFTSLIDRLRTFSEEIVGRQLVTLLLSRMVLLDPTAQLCVVPFLLKPRVTEDHSPLFSPETFRTYIVPVIIQIFCVRDAQIRMILLEYFSYFIVAMSKEELRDNILPQLLLGIKDTNDLLVAATLRCLADLVPMLGSAIVVGRNRKRLFADGRPQGLPDATIYWNEPRSITPVMNNVAGSEFDNLRSVSPMLDNVDISDSYTISMNRHRMPERLSPDGGEDVETTSDAFELDDDNWSDWDADTATAPPINENIGSLLIADNSVNNNTNEDNSRKNSMAPTNDQPPDNLAKDIKQIDIRRQDVEMDFFHDMEPIIQKTNILLISDKHKGEFDSIENSSSVSLRDTDNFKIDNSRFEIRNDNITESTTDEGGTTGWGDDSDWDVDNDSQQILN